MNPQIIDLFPSLANVFKDNWLAYRAAMKHTFPQDYTVSFETGSKFARIVVDNGQRSTIGFVALKDGIFPKSKKPYTAGTLLKAAGWKAPALNFARGSIFTLDDAETKKYISWTGIS